MKTEEESQLEALPHAFSAIFLSYIFTSISQPNGGGEGIISSAVPLG